jgi:hypothetical protein
MDSALLLDLIITTGAPKDGGLSLDAKETRPENTLRAYINPKGTAKSISDEIYDAIRRLIETQDRFQAGSEEFIPNKALFWIVDTKNAKGVSEAVELKEKNNVSRHVNNVVLLMYETLKKARGTLGRVDKEPKDPVDLIKAMEAAIKPIILPRHWTVRSTLRPHGRKN